MTRWWWKRQAVRCHPCAACTALPGERCHDYAEWSNTGEKVYLREPHPWRVDAARRFGLQLRRR
jgi:hypothetical protein